jgi:hypothetical protein
VNASNCIGETKRDSPQQGCLSLYNPISQLLTIFEETLNMAITGDEYSLVLKALHSMSLLQRQTYASIPIPFHHH